MMKQSTTKDSLIFLSETSINRINRIKEFLYGIKQSNEKITTNKANSAIKDENKKWR